MLWKRGPFFVEIQRSLYYEKVMTDKFNRYVSYFMSNECQQEPWQPADRKTFPSVILISDTRYTLQQHPTVKFFQVQNIQQFLTFISVRRDAKKVVRAEGKRFKLKA